VEVNKDINILRGSLYKNINNVRRKLNYKLDVGTEIPCHLAYTFKKEEFLLYECEEFKIFGTLRNLECLKKIIFLGCRWHISFCTEKLQLTICTLWFLFLKNVCHLYI
jgi:hypothetical protein